MGGVEGRAAELVWVQVKGPRRAVPLCCSVVCVCVREGCSSHNMLSLMKFPRVFDVHQVPRAFQEDSIISGYRHPCCSATDCVLSLFQLTNETLNVWTHFLPTWYFLWKLLTLVFMKDAWTDVYTWPLLLYLLSCCMYPLASSCAHTFNSMSMRARHVCFFFDYGALSLYTLGSAITYSAYVMPAAWVNGSFHMYYVPQAVFNSALCTAISCYSRFPECPSPKGKMLRAAAFTYAYLFVNIPLFYRIFLCVGEGCTVNEANSLHIYHTLLAFLTGFLFTSHLPERLAPGRFDYIGHSHQLFHVCGTLGTHFQMQAIEVDMNLRRQWLLAHAPAVTWGRTVGAVVLAVLLSLGIIFLFSKPLFRCPHHKTVPRTDKGGAKRRCSH